MMKMLKYDVARCFTSCTEDIIEVVCEGCLRNVDGPDFCPIQAQYGAYGEHPEIVGRKMGRRLRVQCLSMELPSKPPAPQQLGLWESRP